MKLSNLNEPIFSTSNILKEIYRGNLDKINLSKVSVDDDDYIKYVNFVKENMLEDWPLPEPFIDKDISLEEFDSKNQDNWFIPDEYKNINIEKYLFSLCKTQAEVERVSEELQLFEKHRMICVLKFLKYLVDTMRSNNVLWGVGRGSSVASYCLYLLGIHKIDSLKYQLDIKEFLRGE